MSGINAGIAEVEKQIRQVEEQVQQAAENAANAADKEDRDYWRKKEEDLRKKEKDLRKKEKDLREEKKDLRKKEMMLLEAQNAAATKTEGPVLSMSVPTPDAHVRLGVQLMGVLSSFLIVACDVPGIVL